MSKKGKKGKWKQVDLKTLLPDSQPALAKAQWCDEVDDENKEFSVPVRKPVLPTAPRSVRGTDDERVPMDGPFMAYVTNIPFEVEDSDIAEFFGDLEIASIQLPKNLDTAKLKGFGYVEFMNRSGLIDALRMSDTSLKGRRVRIEVSDNNDRRGMDRMGRNRMGLGRDRDDDGPDRTLGDWRSGPRAELPNEERDRFRSREGGFGGGGFRDREKDSFGAPRELDTKEGGWREGMGSGSSGASERFSDRDRDSYRSRDSFGDRGGYGERRPYGDRERDGGYDRDRGSSRYGDRDGYGPPRGDRDGPIRRSDNDSYSRDGPPSESGEPKARPKLQLQPRSRPVETPAPVKEVAQEPAAVAAAPPAPRPSIFGAAKPVDTAARERQIEERLAKERDRPKPDSEPRSKESSEHGDEPRSSKKVEPAPPPKENAWTRRPRIENEGNNGESGRDYEYDERRTSPSDRRAENHDGDQDYRNRRDGYGRQEYGREGGYKDGHSSYRDGYRDTEGSRPHREESGRGSSSAVKDNSSHGDDHGSATDRPPRREHSDDQPRMPKYEEKQVPNFAGSNKYEYLHEDDEREGASD